MTPFRAAVFLNLLTGIALFLHIRKGLIAGVCPLKMYGLVFRGCFYLIG